MSSKIVYVAMCADILHHGHLNVINIAKQYGKVIVGLLTDSAITSYKRLPLLEYEQRKIIVENIKGVDRVIKQNSLDYTANLELLKPDYVVHGDDWKKGSQKQTRQKVINKLKEWEGRVIDVPYTSNISSTKLQKHIKDLGVTPEVRLKSLKRLIDIKPLVRIMEVHNGLSGLVVEKVKFERQEFDGMWLSSLTHSASKGKPDIQYVDITTINQTLSEVFDVTTKPMIVDADNGGLTEHFKFVVKNLERLGVSAVIIEDKIGNKRNSLFSDTSEQTQDFIENFCYKISEGKKSLITKDFMIIARIESFILGKGLKDAMNRATAYIEAGASGIMIHSKSKRINEIASFCKEYRKLQTRVPLVVVPTTYNHVTENELEKLGINVVIYANHLLRSSYPAMVKTAASILQHKRSYESNEICLPIKEILKLIPYE